MAAVSDIKIHFRTCMHQPGEKLLIKLGILGIIVFHFRSLRGGGVLKNTHSDQAENKTYFISDG